MALCGNALMGSVITYQLTRPSNSCYAVQVMQQAGAYVKEEVCRALIVLISNAPELHGYAARSMYRALKTSIDDAGLNLSLVTSTCWFLGAPHDSFSVTSVSDCTPDYGVITQPV